MSLGWKWFTEYQTPHSAHMHGIKEILFSRKTKFQQIDIFDSDEYGRMLVLDGKVQSTVKDEYFYHESLVHPLMFAHPNPKDVLIIGGGEGGTLREVLRHPVRRVVMVDIDKEVVEASKKYLPQMSAGAFEDARAELVFGDGRRYVEGCSGQFDLIIMDVTDPLENGPGQLLYTREFYEAAKGALRNEGMIVTQATSTFYSTYCFATIMRTVRRIFGEGRAGGYHTFVPAYDSTWGFVYGTKGPDPKSFSRGELAEKMKARGVSGLRYYNEDIHRCLFVLPKEVVDNLEGDGSIATDSKPTFMPI
jgi:spermidine synthase